MKTRLILFVLLLGAISVPSAKAEVLTAGQIESIKAKIKSLRENLEGHLSNRNSSAGQIFAQAAVDSKAALSLYLDCHKVVEYDKENRPESDFRAWKDGQEDRIKNAQFVESLQMQLRYLALSCQAAESTEIESVFAPLLSYVDSLSRLEESPTNSLTGSVAGSIFSKRYNLENLLGQNPNWEPVPFNIGGIYEKTIFPYLREKKPEALVTAWDKRIEQQSRIVAMIQARKIEDLRGLDRDQERRARGNQDRQGGMMGDLDQEDYLAKTLPRLKWGKLKDQFLYVDEVIGAKAMLDFVEAHLTHELAEEFFNEFTNLIDSRAGKSSGALPGEFDSN
tara:strand:- start:2640 stop:3647 length:1008 start_codon:yes stop_codon:yes gene_type:complete